MHACMHLLCMSTTWVLTEWKHFIMHAVHSVKYNNEVVFCFFFQRWIFDKIHRVVFPWLGMTARFEDRLNWKWMFFFLIIQGVQTTWKTVNWLYYFTTVSFTDTISITLAGRGLPKQPWWCNLAVLCFCMITQLRRATTLLIISSNLYFNLHSLFIHET